MVFASGIFLFLFLPVTFIGNWLLRNRSTWIKNSFLLLMSMFFYLESGFLQFCLLVMSILINYSFARLMSYTHQKERKNCKTLILIIAVIYNVSVLFVFKYLKFLLGEVGGLFGWGVPEIISRITLPLGISFYTFQALSYVIDVYRNNNLVEKKLVNVALYISFFPQLVAGPIVRWDQIRNDLNKYDRIGKWNEGFRRFSMGLGKKVIIANYMALFADKAFMLLEEQNLTMGFAWMGAIAYTLQIYFDFSGYSDMAIGLGAMFGFDFPENFHYPYISKSITEFWRRWHISLSSWFRDYVYIPLGGNRCKKTRMFFNLFVVWLLTGIWHGANYTFWLWGILYYLFLVMEKTAYRLFGMGGGTDKIKNKYVKRLICTSKHIYTMLVVILLWVIFRSDTVTQALHYISCMFGKTSQTVYSNGVTQLYLKSFVGYAAMAVIGCTPWMTKIQSQMSKVINEKYQSRLAAIWTVVIFMLACCIAVDSNYNPFIYFNF